MLLTKPLYLRREMKRTEGAGYSNVSTDNLLHQNDGPTPLLSEIPANGSMDSIISGSIAPQEGVAVEEMHSDEVSLDFLFFFELNFYFSHQIWRFSFLILEKLKSNLFLLFFFWV